MRSSYRFLWRDRRVLEFLGASVAGRLCFSMLPLGIVLFSRDVSGSIAVAGAAAGAFGLTSAVLSPVRGHLVDRVGWGALAGLSVAFGAALGAYIAAGSSVGTPAAVVALAGGAGALAPPIGAAARAVWGTAFREREPELHALYAADTTLEEGTLVAGPLLVGAIVAIASAEAAVVAAAIGIVIAGSASALSTLGRTLVPHRGAGDGGIRAAGMSRRLLILVASLVGPAAALGCLEVSVPAFADEHGSIAWAGPLLAVVSAGSMAGGIWYGTRPQRSTGGSNGGFPEPPAGMPVRVVRAVHEACGAETRVRLPAPVPTHAVRRVVCDRCAHPFACEAVEVAAPSRAQPPPLSRVWTLLDGLRDRQPVWFDLPPGREGRYLAAAGLLALLLLPPILAPSLPVLAALLLLPGVVVGPLFILLYELVDRAAPAGRRTGAFSLVVAANNGSVALGAASAGALVAVLDPWAGFALASASAALGALGALWLVAADARRDPS